MVIRAFNSGQKMEYIDNDYDKLIQIDVSPCEKKLKEMNEISDEESLIIQDVFNYENKEYFFRVFTKEGRELPFCDKNEDIIIKYFKYKIDKPENASSCPEDFPYLLVQTNQCLKNCDVLSFLNRSCITDYITEDIQINNINNLKKVIEEHIIEHLLDNITSGGDDIVVEEKNIKYQLTSTFNQKDINNENISNMNLRECENILRKEYSISPTSPLIIFKLDIDMEGYPAPSVEYEIYNPITKEKLVLKYCNDEQIDVSIPVSIDENELFKYNPKSGYYTDICFTYTTDFKTDITLKDREMNL